ncbi:sensor histidine kinase [Tenacibaculum crassostreae]|uniref:sensor histidine kinase n=1 Tax=Tenacibaculum crassostreae TaxID=502683 RepID=UPI0038B4EBA9
MKFSLISAQNQSIKTYTKNNGLPSLHIQDIAQDSIGYLWLATPKGLVRFDGNSFITYTTKNGLLSNNINTVFVNNNLILIGTNKGLSVKSRNNFKNFEGNNINCILNANNHTFLGTDKGIFRLREEYLSPLRTNFQIDLNEINDLKFDGKFYWVATNKSLWKVDKLTNPTILERIDVDNYTSILVDNKKIIVATYNNGIKIIINGEVKNQPVTLQNIIKVKKIDNQFWIISEDEGIQVFDNDFSFERTINKYNSLSSNNITTIFEDSDQNKWIGTQNAGLYTIKNDNPSPKKPQISFENIEVVFKTLDSININNYNEILQLPSNKNHISFYYKTVDISNSKNIEYRYTLNNKTSPWSSKNNVDLAYLSPGNYTFSSQSRIGNLESEPIQFNFYIDTPLHQKEWFIFSSIGLACLLLGLIIWSYIRRIQVKNKTKIEKLELQNHLLSLEQKALQLQMNPHFIFNVLNGIKALGNSGKSAELNETISKFATLLRGVLHNSRQEEISLTEEITTLKNYIELEQQMSTNSFEYQVTTNLSIDSEEILIPPMLIQPFVENSIKHGVSTIEKGRIDISFSTKHNLLQCEILDNGIGFHQSQKNKQPSSHRSVAMQVTKDRIESLSNKSTFSMTEIKKEGKAYGTKVLFTIPLKTDF